MLKYIIQTTLFIFISFSAFGQEDDIKFDDVKVIKEFSAEIGNFNKINLDPQLPNFDLNSRKYKYNVRAIPMKLEYEKPQIRPLALADEEPKDINNYYIKLGYGLPKYLKGIVSLGMKKGNMNSTITLNHISADNSSGLKDQRNSKTGLDFLYFNRSNSLDIEYSMDININGEYYYLYADKENDNNPYSTAENKRRFLKGDIKAMFKKDEIISNLSNKTKIGYKFLQLNTDKEVEGNLILENISKYHFTDNFLFSLPLKGDIVTGTDKILLHSKPHIMYSSRLLNLKIGGDVGKSQDFAFAYPYAEISANIYGNYIEIFAIAENKIFNNTNYDKTESNPFINFDEDTILTTVHNNYSAGLRSSLEGVKIELKASYQKLKNKLFYISSQLDKRTFSSVYDDGTNIKLEANATYRILPELELSGNATKNFYELDNFPKAWHTPDFTANITAKTILLTKKLQVKGELYFASQSWYRDFDNKKKKLPALFDLSGEASYKLFNKANIFVEVNNIFAQKYQRWYQYPGYNINLLAGIEMAF